MDHEVIPCSFEIFGWLLNLAHNHFSLHEGKKVKVIMELEVANMPIFRPTISTIMVQQVLW